MAVSGVEALELARPDPAEVSERPDCDSKSEGVAPMAVFTEFESAVGMARGSVSASAVIILGERAVGGHIDPTLDELFAWFGDLDDLLIFVIRVWES